MLPPLRVRAEFDGLYRENWDDAVAQARSILRGLSDPADVAATAFTRLWAEITGGRADSLHARLTSHVKAAAEAEYSRAQREDAYLGRAYDEDERVIREGGTHATAIADRLTVPPPTPETQRFAETFDGAVRGLTQKQREAYVLTELRGLSTVEAADLLGVTHQAVSGRRARATESIATALVEGGAA